MCSCIPLVRHPLNTLFVSILVSSFLDPRVNRDNWVFVFSLHKDVFHSCQIKWEHFVFLSLSHTQQSKKHANKVRLFYMLHPEDGGPPSKRLRPDNPVFSLTCIYY